MIRRQLQRACTIIARQASLSEHQPWLLSNISSSNSPWWFSSCSGSDRPAMPGALDRADLEKKLIYRSKQRGWLELDLIMGTWAEKNIPQLSTAELSSFEAILDQEIPDMYRWLTAQEDPPVALQQCPIFHRIKEYVDQRYEAALDESTRAIPNSEWVRGWDDVKSWNPPK